MRGRRGAGPLAAAAFAAALALAGCAPGVQPLLDDYNAMFYVTLAGSGGQVNHWLQDHYEVPRDHTLNLHAPAHCTSYSWLLEPDPGFPKEENKLPDGLDIDRYGGKTSHLYLNLKEAGFNGGTYYKLTCTVVRGGRTLTDSCKLVIVAGDSGEEVKT